MKKLFFTLCITGIFVGCAPSAEEDLNQAIQIHKNATTSDQAKDACRRVFDNEVKKNKSDSTVLCDALIKRTDAELLICEDEINESQFSSLVASCKKDLLIRLENIKRIQGDGTTTTLEGKIPFEIQYRDLSQGYTAITGDTKAKQVILSFDDGPHPKYSKMINDMLVGVGIRAHFMEVGENVKKYPEVTKYISAWGHSIGNHSWNHSDFTQLTLDQQIKQMTDTNQIILQTIGWVDPFFRYPGGAVTPEFNQFLKTHQEAIFSWSIDSNDWRMINADGSVRTDVQVIRETLAQLESKGRGFVLFHDIHERTAKLLPTFLTALREKGYKVVMLQPTNSKLKNSPVLP